MKNKIFKCVALFIFIGLSMMFSGCKTENQQNKKVQDLEFTILQEYEIQQEILAMIEEKKQEAFQFTKTSDPYTYIVVGYGKQNTSGYSIQVEDVYLGEDSIYVETALIGPKKEEAVSEIETFPYVVVKIEARDEVVVFKVNDQLKKGDRSTGNTESANYVAGVYSASVVLRNQVIGVEVVVDENHINSVRLIHTDDTVTTMFPLFEPTMIDLATQIVETQSLENITYSEGNKYTCMVLLEAVKNALTKATATEQ